MKNYPLIRKVWEHIEAHPEEHSQEVWGHRTPCSTTMCFAGHAAVMVGAKPMWEGAANLAEDAMFSRVWTPEGEVVEVEDYAAEQLGLTQDEAIGLFYNTPTALVGEYVQKLLGGEGDEAA